MNRETREIVASACGDRSENTCRILWDRVPSSYKEAIVFSDYWSAYRAVIPSEQQRPVGKEIGETAHEDDCERFFVLTSRNAVSAGKGHNRTVNDECQQPLTVGNA